jgi:hypothetical protein
MKAKFGAIDPVAARTAPAGFFGILREIAWRVEWICARGAEGQGGKL